MAARIVPVILCGGSGSRLWPMSRRNLPKQFLPLVTGRSLLQDTALRLRSSPIVLASHDLNLAASLCHALVLMRAGRVLAQGATGDVLNGAMIRQLYDVDADVRFHEASGHLTVVPIGRAR